MPNLEPVIGLEVHVHLSTQSKLFCSCKNVSEADRPNTYVCPICMGFPGTLPVLNKQAVEWTILAGLALGCKIAEHCTFARKSYFYPDLPKGYQISQYEEPLCTDGSVPVFAGEQERTVRIQRVHLEEDAAKNVHTDDATLVDHNRAGTPLIEIVTAPDVRSPAEAKTFLENLQRAMWYLGISRADMEHGDLRVDANVSLREPHFAEAARGGQAGGSGEKQAASSSLLPAPNSLHPKTEIKNLNSFRAVERALAYEIERQSKLWAAGMPPAAPSTRGWNDERQETVEQRMKEEEADYRYFPEPDIPPLRITSELVNRLRESLPELPYEKEERFRRQYRMAAADAHLLVGDRRLAAHAEQTFSEIAQWIADRTDVDARETPHLLKLATNYLLGDFRNMLAQQKASADRTKAAPENFAELILMLHREEVNRNVVPTVLRLMHETGGDPSAIVRERGLAQVSDVDALRRLVQDVVTGFPAEVDKIRAGRMQVLEFLVGQVMAKTQGRANPNTVRQLIREELDLSTRTDSSGA